MGFCDTVLSGHVCSSSKHVIMYGSCFNPTHWRNWNGINGLAVCVHETIMVPIVIASLSLKLSSPEN